MTFDDIPQHLRTAAFYAEAATARRPVFVPRRLYDLVKEYLAWKENRKPTTANPAADGSSPTSYPCAKPGGSATTAGPRISTS